MTIISPICRLPFAVSKSRSGVSCLDKQRINMRIIWHFSRILIIYLGETYTEI